MVALWEKIVAADQAWYWTAEWQSAEAEADAELAAGKYDNYASMDALLADLETAPR